MTWLHFVPWHWLFWLSLPFALVACGWYFAATTTAALLKRVSLSAWLLIAVVVIGGLYHVGAVASAADGAAKAEAAKSAQKIAELTTLTNGQKAALDQINARADREKAESDARAKLAAQMIGELGRESAQAQTKVAELEMRLKQAAQSPDCATVASMKLCTALQHY